MEDHHRLAIGAHLGFIKLTGCTLDKFNVLPTRLLEYLGGQLNIEAPDIASLRTLYRRRQTLSEHQSFAIKILGVSIFNDRRQRVLTTYLRKQAIECDSTIDQLIVLARKWLYENRILIPSEQILRKVARRSLRGVEEDLARIIKKIVPAKVRTDWLNAVFAKHEGNQSILAWLQEPPGQRSMKTLKTAIAKVNFLKQLSVDEFDLTEISLPKQSEIANRARNRQPKQIRRLKEPKRSIELVCLLRVTLLELTDVVFSLADMQTSKIFRHATEKAKEDELDTIWALRKSLADIRRLLEDTTIPVEQLRQLISALLPQAEASKSLASRVREILSNDARLTRPLIKQLSTISFCEAPDSSVIAALSFLRELYERDETELPMDIPLAHRSGWNQIIGDNDRRRALRAYEAATLQALLRGLRNGSIWNEHSLTHRSRDKIFIPPDLWKDQKKRHYKRMGVPRRIDRHLRPIQDLLKQGLTALTEAVRAKEVVIEERDIHLQAIRKEPKPRGLTKIRSKLFSAVGTAQLPDVIVELDSQIRFSWILLGRAPRTELELLSIYGGILAHGTDLNASSVSRMTPGLTEKSVNSAMKMMQNERKIREANQALADFLFAHKVTRIWGDGTLASADAFSLSTSRKLWNARVDPKNRQYAVGLYTHLLNRRGIIYDQPVILGKRQAGPAIEGAIRQTSSNTLNRVAVDTHGYTDFGLAVAKLLGFDLCPRLSNMKQRRLHVLKDMMVPTELEAVVKRDVSLDEMTAGWDEFVRVVASIDSGWTSATLALERFGSAARGDPIHRTGTALGRLYRTLYLCDYFTNSSFRRELLRILNHGESVHVLQRAIHRGSVGVHRGRRKEELIAISGSLNLLTNIVLTWTTNKIQAVLDSKTNQIGVISEKYLRHIMPFHHRDINLNGVLQFPICRYAHRLLDKPNLKTG